MFRKLLSLAISFSFLFTSLVTPASAVLSTGSKHSQVEAALIARLTPPAKIGSIVDARVTANTPLVVHIQDLHANYGVQRNIAQLLEFLDSRLGVGSYRVGVEGAQGPIAITGLGNIPDRKFKEKMGDLLMKEAEMTGTEYFSIVQGRPDLLWGVEDQRYHDVNIELFQSTYKGKQQLAAALDSLQQDLKAIKGKYYSREMRKLDKQTSAYLAGKLDLADYVSTLVNKASRQGIDIAARYPETAKWTGFTPATQYADYDKLMTEQADLVNEVQAGLAKNDLQRQISATTHELDILRRMVTEEVTTEEVRRLAPQLSTLLARVQHLLDKSGVRYDKKNLAELVSSSLDFYAVALLRDQFLAENSLKLFSEKNAPKTVVLVAGGFHTPGITRVLKGKGVSYITIAPTVDSHTDKDKQLYVERLMERHPDPETLVASGRMLSPRGGLRTAVSAATAWGLAQVQFGLEGARAQFVRVPPTLKGLAQTFRLSTRRNQNIVRVKIPAPLQPYTDRKSEVEVSVTGDITRGNVINGLVAMYPGLESHVKAGDARSFVSYFDGKGLPLMRPSDPVSGGELEIIPAIAGGAPDSDAAMEPAQNVAQLLKNIAPAVMLTPTGVQVVDNNLLRSQVVAYLVDEARFSTVKPVRDSAQRILREVGIAMGVKEASIHDFYMARTGGVWSNATVPAYNVRVNAFETMKQIFRAAIDDNSVFILELAKSEKRYTDQTLAEFTAMGYAAAIATGYKGLIFFQGDHYQTDKGTYAKDPAKAMSDIENLILEAVLAGKRNIDVDPSTLVNEEALDKILAFEKRVVDRYIQNRSEADVEFANYVESLGGVQADVTQEGAGMKTLRRKLVDDLEVGYESGDAYREYRDSLTLRDRWAIGQFGLTPDEKAQIKDLYKEMHATTFEVTMHYIRFIRNLEKQLGITSPISIGVEERHIDTPKHKDFPSTVLGSITLTRQVIDQTAKEGLVGPSKLALQTGTMHGLGGVVEWGIFERHQRARKAIGVEIFVQHGTSTLDKGDFKNMPKAGTGEAHLATEYQKISLGIIASRLPELRQAMAAFLEALIYPDRAIADPAIETKIREAKLFDVEKRRAEYEKKFRDKWEAAMAQSGKSRDDVLVEIFNDSLPGKLKGSLKDLVKELSGPFKREIAAIPTEVQNESNRVLYTEFRRINADQNFVGMQQTMEAIIPFASQDVALPYRPGALAKAVAGEGSAMASLPIREFGLGFLATGIVIAAAALITPALLILTPLAGLSILEARAGYLRNRAAGLSVGESLVTPGALSTEPEAHIPQALKAHEIGAHGWLGLGEVGTFFAKHLIALAAVTAQAVRSIWRTPASDIRSPRVQNVIRGLEALASISPLKVLNTPSQAAVEAFQAYQANERLLAQQRVELSKKYVGFAA